MADATEEFYDGQKALHGRFATFVWIAGSVILFFLDGGFRRIISWQALLFIFVGMFVAAIIVGNATYFIQRKVASSLVARIAAADMFSESTIQKVKRIAVGMLVVDFALATLFVVWCYASLFWS